MASGQFCTLIDPPSGMPCRLTHRRALSAPAYSAAEVVLIEDEPGAGNLEEMAPIGKSRSGWGLQAVHDVDESVKRTRKSEDQRKLGRPVRIR